MLVENRRELPTSHEWKWILTQRKSARWNCFGFDPGEVRGASVSEVEGAGESESGQEVVVCINADDPDLDGDNVHRAATGAKAVVIVGARQRVALWRRRLCYHKSEQYFGFLPPASPRVLVSLSTGRSIRTGLMLHRPGRAIARLTIAFGYTLTFAGVGNLLFSRQMCVVAHSIGDVMAAIVNSEASSPVDGLSPCLTYYIGTAGESKKLVVLRTGESDSGVIAKVALNERAARALVAEFEILKGLACTPIAPHVPRVVSISCVERRVVLEMEYRRRRAFISGRLSDAVRRFLVALAGQSRDEIDIRAVLKMGSQRNRHNPDLVNDLVSRIEGQGQSCRIRVTRVHGDFAPWNCAMSDKGLFVYDWEFSRPNGLALSDAIYFHLAPYLLVRSTSSPRRAVRDALNLAAEVGREIGLGNGEIRLCIDGCLLLLARDDRYAEDRLALVITEYIKICRAEEAC